MKISASQKAKKKKNRKEIEKYILFVPKERKENGWLKNLR